MREALAVITDAFTRGKGTFALARLTRTERAEGRSPFVLCAGAVKVVHAKGGLIVTLALDREKVERLRAMCDDALKEEDADVQ